MIIAGITGGSGSGKTYVLHVWKQKGVFIIDADRIYHGLLETSFSLRTELYSRFGAGVFADGKVDRRALGELVFHDPAALRDLNAITHRHVIGETHRILDAHHPPQAAIDAIALIESGISDECDAVVCVVADRERRIARIMQRDGIDRQRAETRIAAQKPDEFFIQNSHYVIRNDGDESDLQIKSEEIYERIFIRQEIGKDKAIRQE